MNTPGNENAHTEDRAAASKRKAKGEKRPPKKITEKYLTNSGLAYLQRFVSGTQHFRSIMMRKITRSCAHHKEQDIETCKKALETVIEKFQTMALLDDTAYAKGMVTSLHRRGLSSRAIEYKLLQKGLNRDQISKALQDMDIDTQDHDTDFIAALRLARRKKIGPFRQKNISAEKQLAAFGRSGFSYEIAAKILSMPLEEAENILTHQS